MSDDDDELSGYHEPELDAIIAPIELEDIIALESSKESLPYSVICIRCGGKVHFHPYPRDIDASEFVCIGRLYSYATSQWQMCGMSWNRKLVRGYKLNELRTYMCVELYKTRERRYCLAFEEHKGKTAYHYIREITEEESWEEQRTILKQIRQEVKQGKR